MSIKTLPFGELEKFNVVIEIAQGSQDKYEYDEKLDVIKLDRVLYGAQRFPGNYGFIPETRAEDGDHADALVFSTNPFIPGIVVACRAIGMMEMVDGGETDNKIMAVPVDDPRFEDVKSMEDMPHHRVAEIRNFFETYKVLQKKNVEVKDFVSKEAAIKELESTRATYAKESGK